MHVRARVAEIRLKDNKCNLQEKYLSKVIFVQALRDPPLSTSFVLATTTARNLFANELLISATIGLYSHTDSNQRVEVTPAIGRAPRSKKSGRCT